MRTIALLVCALALTSGDALAAAAKKVKASGCVDTFGACLLLRTSGNGGFFLTGSNLPPPGGPKQVTVQGQLSGETGSFLCPTRLIIQGNIAVAGWKATRRNCPRR